MCSLMDSYRVWLSPAVRDLRQLTNYHCANRAFHLGQLSGNSKPVSIWAPDHHEHTCHWRDQSSDWG